MTTLLPCELDQPREPIQRIPDTNAASVDAADVDAHEQAAVSDSIHIGPRHRYHRAVRQTLFDPHRCYVNGSQLAIPRDTLIADARSEAEA
jgi:hypothetical protein